MALLPTEVIKKKRDGLTNTLEEIQFMVMGYTRDEIPDYQMSAWLMAILLKGMNDEETLHLTTTMLHSGKTIQHKNNTKFLVDKHSTGGVGDKTSIILGPLVASCGLGVPMIAGRGLGHTGGTLDKLEAIPGFSTKISSEQFVSLVDSVGICIAGQTQDICPADKKIYALRDVTATVESYPLICASIMSKKLAEGIDGLVLDVKYGSGAFMKTTQNAQELANKLIAIGKGAGKKVSAFITDMSQPLGRWVGNSYEVLECIEILKMQDTKNLYADTTELSVELASKMILLSGLVKTKKQAHQMIMSKLQDGSAYSIFEKMCMEQGGNLKLLPKAKHKTVVLAQDSGFVSEYNTEKIGNAAIVIKAGRKVSTDTIDPTAAIFIHKKIGDSVEKGEPLFDVYSTQIEDHHEVHRRLLLSVKLSSSPTKAPKLIECEMGD